MDTNCPAYVRNECSLHTKPKSISGWLVVGSLRCGPSSQSRGNSSAERSGPNVRTEESLRHTLGCSVNRNWSGLSNKFGFNRNRSFLETEENRFRVIQFGFGCNRRNRKNSKCNKHLIHNCKFWQYFAWFSCSQQGQFKEQYSINNSTTHICYCSLKMKGKQATIRQQFNNSQQPTLTPPSRSTGAKRPGPTLPASLPPWAAAREHNTHIHILRTTGRGPRSEDECCMEPRTRARVAGDWRIGAGAVAPSRRGRLADG
jgi:hypothetical protein